MEEKYLSCPYLESGIHFNFREVKACCSIKLGPTFIPDYKGGPIDWQEVQAKREQVKNIFKSGEIYEPCQGCFELKEDYWENKTQIDNLYIFHWTHCNCGCVYCVNAWETKGHFDSKTKNSDYYNLMPILKDMTTKNLLAPNSVIRFVGGEPAVLKEFEALIDLFIKNKAENLSFLSSGIKHSKKLEKAIKLRIGEVTISIDSGCKETFYKIKRTDKFDDVVKNTKRYVSCSSNADDLVCLKYILVNGINDNIEEIEKWLSLCEKIGVKRVRLDFDYKNNVGGLETEVNQHYYPLFEYIKKRTDEFDLRLESFVFVEELLKKYAKD